MFWSIYVAHVNFLKVLLSLFSTGILAFLLLILNVLYTLITLHLQFLYSHTVKTLFLAYVISITKIATTNGILRTLRSLIPTSPHFLNRTSGEGPFFYQMMSLNSSQMVRSPLSHGVASFPHGFPPVFLHRKPE